MLDRCNVCRYASWAKQKRREGPLRGDIGVERDNLFARIGNWGGVSTAKDRREYEHE